MYTDLSVREFVARLASSAPVPGGGAAAALSGALGAALVEMVCNLTIGKRRYQAVEALMTDVRAKSQALREDLLRLVEEDAAAYSTVADAYRMPRTTDEERRRREQAIQVALRAAAQPPLAIARACRAVLPLAAEAAHHGNEAVVSDAGVAAQLALSGLRSAVLNVQINLQAVRDENWVARIREDLAKIDVDMATLAATIEAEVNRKIGVEQ